MTLNLKEKSIDNDVSNLSVSEKMETLTQSLVGIVGMN
jgi:hypothetical protein